MNDLVAPRTRGEGLQPRRVAAQLPRPRWRTLFSALTALGAFFALGLALSSGLGLFDLAEWAATQQRAFHEMIGKLLSAETGGFFAMATLVGACLAYGFVHAAVPGHGKFLIAGAGLASRVSATKLVGLSLLASLCQAVVAIILVYGGFALLEITAGWAMAATNRILIPLSYAAIAVIALVLMRRGVKGLEALWQPADHHHHNHDQHDHDHHHDGCGCGHRHGPSAEEVERLTSLRDAAALVIGIGLRPCTGAVFVLVAAWRFNLEWLGVAGAVAMALGTGAFISIVAVSAVGARGATFLTAGAKGARVLAPVIQLVAGSAIFVVAAAFLVASLTLA